MKLQHSLFSFSLMVLVGLVLSMPVFGQNAYMVVGGTQSLNPDQQARMNRLTASPKFSSVSQAVFSSLSGSIDAQGNLEFELPASGCDKLVFAPNHVEYTSETEYYWYGDLVNTDTCGCYWGTATFISKGSKRYGELTVNETKFEIHDLTSGISAIAEQDASHWNGKQCIDGEEEKGGIGAPNTNAPEQNANDSRTQARNQMCEVSILVMFSNNAANANGIANINDVIDLAIAQTHQAYFNSDIAGCDLRLRLVGAEELVGWTANPTQINNDVDFMRTDPFIAGRRQATGADVVILLTGMDYDNGVIGTSGYEVLPNNTVRTNLGNPQADLAFALLNVQDAASSLTFAHELGHVLGARHQDCQRFTNPGCDDNGTIEHGFSWSYKPCFLKPRRYYTTVMHQLRQNRTRTKHYSNPDVISHGKPTGFAGEEDNAQWLRGTACTVAGYENPLWIDNPLGVVIHDHDRTGCDGIPVDICMTITGDAPTPYNWQWYASNDGVNYSPISGSNNQNCLLWSYPPNVGDQEFIQVRVTAANGDEASATTSVRTTCYDGYDRGSNPNILQVYTNPISHQLDFSLYLAGGGNVDYKLIDVAGNVVIHEAKNNLQQGIYRENMTVSPIQQGLYVLAVSTPEGILSQKIMKIK